MKTKVNTRELASAVLAEVMTDQDSQHTIAETLLANAKVVNGVKFVELPLFMLVVHPEVQRKPKGSERKIAAAWDRKKCGAITVSYRDGMFWIIDGQHRYLAARMVGERSIACQVYEGLTLQQEALLFGSQGDNVVRLNTVDKVKALLIGEDKDTVELKEVCDAYDLALLPEQKGKTPRLTGLQAARVTMRIHGKRGLQFAFRVIKDADWHWEPGAYGEQMILTLRNLYSKYQNNADEIEQKIAQVLSPMTYDDLFRQAKAAVWRRGTHIALTKYLDGQIRRRT